MSLPPIHRACARCLRCVVSSPRASAPQRTGTGSRHFQVSARQRDLNAEREAARQRAWYLDPTPSPSSAPTPSESSPTSGSPTARPLSPSSSSTRESGSPRSAQLAQSPRQPVFTSYDPSRTTASAPTSTPSAPLPSSAPAHLHPLHAFLTQSELIQEGSVVFVHTPSSPHAQGVGGDVAASVGAGTGKEELQVGDISGTDPSWEWVVMGVVKGRGKGVVARAERALRVWVRLVCVLGELVSIRRLILGREREAPHALQAAVQVVHVARWSSGEDISMPYACT